MRLFIAINFHNEIKDTLCNIMQDLRTRSVRGNFTRRDNLHLTLVFIGETTNLDAIKNVMDKVDIPSFDLHLGGIGKFHRSGGDIYWVGVEKNEILYELYHFLYAQFTKEGFQLENREYKPHLTLGREAVLKDNESIEVPNMNMMVKKISLMKSERVNGQLIYTEIYAKELRKDEA